jgi:hypothetical protein
MTQLSTAVTTAGLTAFLGFLVFVVGQFLLRTLIEPLQEYRELKGEVSYALLYYANIDEHLTPPDEFAEARKHLRALAARLRKTHTKIPFYNLCAACTLVPQRQNLFKASTEFVGWSNGLRRNDDVSSRRKIIAECLGIDEVY